MTKRLLGIVIFLAAGLALLIAAIPLSAPENAGGGATWKNHKDLAPHRATYEIRMVSRESGAQVLNVSGHMAYEWNRDCDGWATDHNFELYYEYADTLPVRVRSHFATYEDFAGETLNFAVIRRRNGDIFEELRGTAERKSGQEGKVLYAKPDDLSFTLPKGSFFPTAHTIALVKKMRADEKLFNATVFDGSDDKGPVEINSFIGRPVNALEEIDLNENIDSTLLESPANNIRMAFFPIAEDSPTADYEMNAYFHENGIISWMKVEYQDFSVTQSLTKLEKLSPLESCETKESL